MQNNRNADVLRRFSGLGRTILCLPEILFIRMPQLFVFYK